MADLARLYDFEALETISAEKFDEEFNQLIARINNLPADALESSDLATYRTLKSADAYVGGPKSGSRMFAQGITGGSLIDPSVDNQEVPILIPVAAVDYDVGAKAEKLRLTAQVLCNGTAPGVTIAVTLNPLLSVSGTGLMLRYTRGAAVPGSTVTFTTPAANSVNQGNSGDFDLPADGLYVVSVVFSGATPSNSALAASFQLRMRHV